MPDGIQAKKGVSKGRHSVGDKVFKLQVNKKVNVKLKSFAMAAGITDKKVTFHTARHTCATLLLSLGVPIETVSKILGHSEIKTKKIWSCQKKVVSLRQQFLPRFPSEQRTRGGLRVLYAPIFYDLRKKTTNNSATNC
jgi:hypothetical protein